MSATDDSYRDCRVLFVSAFMTPFIEDDLTLLRSRYRVRTMIGHGTRHALRLFGRVFRSDLVFCWFASVYAGVAVRAARISGVPAIVVVAGVDAAKEPSYHYGIWLSPWRARFARYALRKADAVLVVDPSLGEAVRRLADYDGRNIHFLPSGYDTEFWKPLGEKEREVLTVAVVRDETTYRRKGIDTLVAAARRLPDVPFTVVGVTEEMQRFAQAPENVHFIAPIPRHEILAHYRRARVYCQPSRFEGLPNALCEAMLTGCVPVVTAVNGNPTAVGDIGYQVSPGDAEELAAAILRAFMLEEGEGDRARNRIAAFFPRDRRVRDLTRLIEGLVQ